MSVTSTHPEYDEMIDEWDLVKACSSGSREVKKLGTKILPPPGEKNGAYNKTRYAAYLKRAIYTNITGRTVNGLKSAAFRMPPKVELPAGLEYLNENSDGAGQSLEQLAKASFINLLETGRDGFLADYPEVEEGLTEEQVKALDAKAYIKKYEAKDIINWKTENIAGVQVVTLVVLQECYDSSTNEFQHNPEMQCRVLRLNGGVYTQQIYRKGAAYTEEVEPKQANGLSFDFIPFFFCGAENNDPSVDEVPVSDIAHVNIGHYRNSADLEENSFIHGQLTLGITSSLDSEEWQKMNPNGVVVGAQAGHFLGENGGFTSVQADPNQIADKLQERKEQQMLSLGARLVEKRSPNETAEAAKIDASGENSVLSDIVTNLEEALQRPVEWCGMFMGEEGDAEVELNRQFFDDSLDPQLLMAAIQGYDRAVLAKSDLQDSYRKAGLINQERTNEDIDSETGQASPIE